MVLDGPTCLFVFIKFSMVFSRFSMGFRGFSMGFLWSCFLGRMASRSRSWSVAFAWRFLATSKRTQEVSKLGWTYFVLFYTFQHISIQNR